jgi:deoxyadenosine/deoxycytidine kinase
LDYLKKLNDYYSKFTESYKEGPLLIIDCDKNKFAENEEHFGEILGRVDSQLYGLF